MKIIITSEHGTNAIPKNWQYLFKDHQAILDTHRGYDIGSKDIATLFAKKADAFVAGSISRLLIDLNRSTHHINLFSEFSSRLPPEEKTHLIEQYYLPYRNAITQTISSWLEQNQVVIHLSIHSFTPILHQKIRRTEIGLLYDPQRNAEKSFCTSFKKQLNECSPHWRVRMNYPYRGTADGFCTELRKRFSNRYIGIELETNQALLMNDNLDVASLLNLAFYATIGNF